MMINQVSGGREGVEAAIRNASAATGVDFGFLLKTARRESALNPAARAHTSSAAGLFQFVDQTWLGAVKRFGSRHGLGQWSQLIQGGGSGGYHVADAGARHAILDLRFDPHASALMAGEMMADHAAYLRGRTGTAPTAADLYAAHFLGPAGSARLMETVRTAPGASAASLFPEAADANPSVFFRGGRPLSVAQLHASFEQLGTGAPVELASADVALGEKSEALAQRLDRLRRDSALLDAFNAKPDGATNSLLDAQLLGAFGPESG